jgi:hypothetical protein
MSIVCRHIKLMTEETTLEEVKQDVVNRFNLNDPQSVALRQDES